MKSLLLALVLVIILGGCGSRGAPRPQAQLDSRIIESCAHRGYSAAFPENTIAAFQGALDAGFETIECDVRLSRDGIPVVRHDSASSKTAAEWVARGVPSLTEVVEFAQQHNMHFYYELKDAYPDAVTKAMAIIKTPCSITSDNYDAVILARQLSPQIRMSFQVGSINTFINALKLVDLYDNTIIRIDYVLLLNNPALLIDAQSHETELVACIINDPAIAIKIVDIGATRISSDCLHH